MTQVEIPRTISGQPVEIIGKEAFAGCVELEKIDFPMDASLYLKKIEENAFRGCVKLVGNGKSTGILQIPFSVNEIGSGAFSNCTALEQVWLQNNVEKISKNLFQGCTGLTQVSMSSKVTEIDDYAFQNCSALQSILIPEKVTRIGMNVFENCKGLETVDFTYNTSLTELNYRAFVNCTSLKSIELPDTVRHLYGITFSGCTNLVSVRLPAEVESFGSFVFENCSSLESIQIPRGINVIGMYSFRGCGKLTSVTVPEGVTAIKSSAFDGCPLIRVMLPASLTEIGHAVFPNDLLEDVYFSGTRAQWDSISVDSNNWVLKNKNLRIHCADDSSGGPVQGVCGERLSWALEDGELLVIRGEGPMEDYGSGAALLDSGSGGQEEKTAPWAYARETIRSVFVEPGVTYLGANAFAGCGELRQISLPESLESVGENAFQDCEKLSGVNYGGSGSDWEKVSSSLPAALTDTEVQTGNQVSAAWKEDGSIRVSGTGDWAISKYYVKKVFAAVLDEKGQFTAVTGGTLTAGIVTLTDGTIFPDSQEGAEMALFLLNQNLSPLCAKLSVR